jgi:glucosylceramidase
VPYRAGGKHNITDLPSFEHSDFPFGPVVGDTRTREELNALGFPAEYLDKGVVVQPMYYYMGHISRHVRPGSRAVHAIVDKSNLGSNSRTFLQTINNSTVAGGGINDLARPGVEITLWPCEGSTRQEWTMSDNGQFQVFGHDWLGKPTVACVGKDVDPSFKGILLSHCDASAGIFRTENLSNSTMNILIENSGAAEGQNCLVAQPLKNNGGAYGPRGGAQVIIGPCDSEAVSPNYFSLVLDTFLSLINLLAFVFLLGKLEF